ncbi:hypothetical protein CWI38_0043p0020 [Hamiltosporidium tvaerminnensis]|uniref:Uncharacterized protein n=1 Tax=Hamiltosporidium tvaerminnensis TaxID=1176355 RepID=A0A4Q9M4E8_9MICR|nr:hypothetical protein CWI38_0043p0020 [Hamiltosporidium tvaerminnensis]
MFEETVIFKNEFLSFYRRRGLESGLNAEESVNGYGAKNLKPKNNVPLISQGNPLEEPTNNINEESDLEEKQKWLKR